MPNERWNEAMWLQVGIEAKQVDPLIREALRPVFERLKSEAPHLAAGMALAMICRALAMLDTRDPKGIDEHRRAVAQFAVDMVESGGWAN